MEGPGRVLKCLVWDLDNTLWQGTLADGEQPELFPGRAELVRELDRRGILQSIASRNHGEEALEQLGRLGLAEFFLCPQCGFFSKERSLAQIAQELNIGLDAVAFVDDDPFELAQVGYHLPQVRLFRAPEELNRLLEEIKAQGEPATWESAHRRQAMQARQLRRDEERGFVGSREDFLKSCRMELIIRPGGEEDIPRVCELGGRANQLNSLPGPVEPALCRQYLAGGEKELWVAELRDRFGQHGVVGLCFTETVGERAVLRQFCISCRTEGRGIGAVLLGKLLEKQAFLGRKSVFCPYRPTPRNRQALLLLRSLGFAKGSFLGQEGYEIALPVPVPPVDWVTVVMK